MPSGRGVDTKGVEASTHLVSVSLAGVRAHTLRDLTVHVEAVTAAPALEGTKREANQEVCRDGGRGGASSHSPLKAYCSCMTATSPTYSNTIGSRYDMQKPSKKQDLTTEKCTSILEANMEVSLDRNRAEYEREQGPNQ